MLCQKLKEAYVEQKQPSYPIKSYTHGVGYLATAAAMVGAGAPARPELDWMAPRKELQADARLVASVVQSAAVQSKLQVERALERLYV